MAHYVAAAWESWSREYKTWGDASDENLPFDQPYLKVVRSMHILAVAKAVAAEVNGDSTPRHRLYWKNFFGNVTEESCMPESRVHLSPLTSAERHESFHNTPSVKSLRELLQGMIVDAWDKLGDNDDDRWHRVVRVDVSDEITEPFYEAVRTLLGSDAAISVAAAAEAAS